MNVALHPVPNNPRPLHGISLCTGGGGLDLGLELALPAARSIVMVEREAFAVAHLVAAIEQGFLAPAAIWSDVRTFDGRPWRGVVDFLIGGIPCQPHSLAGKKRGSLDERDLWSPTRRIVVQARPWFGLIENVRGMLSAGADEVAGAARVLRDLRRLGYAVECGLFTAAETGSSHLRPRLFILFVADPDDSRQQRLVRRPRAQEFAPERGEPALAHTDLVELRREPSAGQQQVDERDLAPGLYPPGPSDLDGWRRVLAHSPDLEPSVRRMADGLAARLDLSGPHAARVDRLRLLGNGVVSLEGAYAFRTLVTRLASTGHAGAVELARLMGAPA
ncbi:MAG: DNA cytosine methyltransferase [Devosia sp.]|uniref:DNA cytosine methyltransferase n=1 Tax=Devosia sp. TaxID=1871048 RepID=UPI0024CAC41B|nr:DNA cytosine methyltransferase [Devosia sp.]UYN98377.1 MAG: DNA cytosine methyltransferase [Devosia sp.]